MSGSRRLVGGLAAFLLVSACTVSTTPTASTSTQPSPSPSPSASPSAVASASPSPIPTPPAAAGVAIAALPVHNGEVGVGFLAVTLAAKDGTGPYTWSIASGQLAPGLALSTAGVITGTSTAAGTFAFTAKVTDSAGTSATGKATITVFPAFAVSQPCATMCIVGAGCTVCGSFGKLAGGAGPYTYKVVGGAAPSGMTWNRLSVAGPFPTPPPPPPPSTTTAPPPPPPGISVQVTDGFGVTKTVTARWNIFTRVDFGTSTNAGCYNGPGSCSDSSLTYSGGNPSDNMVVVVVKACYDDPNATYICSDDVGAGPLASYLPPAWTATANGGTVTVGMDCGNPDACLPKTGYAGWYGDVFIVVRDKGACVAPGNSLSTQTADVNIDI